MMTNPSENAETAPELQVERRCCAQPVCVLRRIEEKNLTFSETMSLSLGREGASELLHSRAFGTVTEVKLVGNKLIFKGVFTVSVLYRATDDRLCAASSELPFSQIMEVDSTGDGAMASVCLQVTGVDVQIDSDDDEGRQLAVTLYYHAMAFLRENRELTLLTDLYYTA